MITLELAEAARILGIEIESEYSKIPFQGIDIDSRRIQPGMLFAALPGTRSDGHDFATAADQAGASAVLCTRRLDLPLPQLVVKDVERALGQLASAWCQRMPARVIGITGSNGKTTTKEMIASILERSARVLATAGNFNNELGVPLTLFGLDETHEYLVLEMGAGKAGDIRYLASIAKPEVGLITCVGPAHLDGFGDEEGVARAKGEMYSSLPAGGFAVLNMDEPWVPVWMELKRECPVIGFGTDAAADVHLAGSNECPRVVTPKGEFELALDLPGEHNQLNALAATAVALALGIGLDQIQKGLAETTPVSGRLSTVATSGDWTVIDDTYNANPASLYAALQVLTSKPGEPWLVLADMKELGPSEQKMHAEVGDAAAALGIRRMFTIGQLAMAASEAFGEGARHFEHLDDLIAHLRSELKPGVVCLVKGSRSMHMEQVVAAISRNAPKAEVA